MALFCWSRFIIPFDAAPTTTIGSADDWWGSLIDWWYDRKYANLNSIVYFNLW